MHPRIWNRIFTILFLMAFVAGVIQPAALAAPAERETAAPATQEDALAKIEPLVLEEIAAEGETEFFVWLTAKADLSPANNLKTKLEKVSLFLTPCGRPPTALRLPCGLIWMGSGSNTAPSTSPTRSSSSPEANR
jgi:hypothetical protein